MSQEEIKIALSKKKIVWLVIGAFAFVILSIGITYWVQHVPARATRHEIFVSYWQYFGWWFTPLFFGLCGLFGILKLFDQSPGLTMNKDGITDHSSAIPSGFIPWSEITKISDYSIASNKILTVFVNNPEVFINRGNYWKKMIWKANYKLSGAPVNISANSLQISHDDLLQVLTDWHQKYSGSKNTPTI